MTKAETEIPKGSYAAGERVALPAGAQPPYTVFINGVEQDPSSYRIESGEIRGLLGVEFDRLLLR